MGNYNFVPFPVPKMARFKFMCRENLIDVIQDVPIIGMDGERFVIRLQGHIVCDTSDPDYGKEILLPVGIHQSYFQQWLSTGFQTSLF